ncbi:glycosyltransferase family 4 protein [Flavisolibacter sp. BT320]|nr:glycosyltransferase family 4 protein [Flavisolibacter longurius]
MKVLHILSELQFSGAELMLSTAAEKFKEAGLDVTILSTGPEEGVYAEYFRKIGWHVAHIPFRKTIGFFMQLFKFTKKNQFDVIHVHTEGAFIYKAFTVYFAGSKRIVSTVHNNFLFDTYLTKRRKMHHYLASKFLKVRFTSISESVKETELVIYNTETTLINNWIDVDRFKQKRLDNVKPSDINEKITVPRLVSVGKCIDIKNHQANFELVKELVSRGINCHYIHIGCGELEETEKAWVKKNQLEQYVTFISYTDRVADYLASCDFYLMPSHCEGLGNACVEAMASRLFCIVNDAPGLNTLIEDDVTGLVLDANNIPLVADQIVKFCNDKEEYNRITHNAQDAVAKKYSLKNVDQLIEVYA